MELRAYQQAAIDALYAHLRSHDDNPCIVIPTAGGKTPISATICKDAVLQWGGRVLIVAHVKELLEQAADKLQAIAPELHFGIYSAGLGSRDTLAPVIIAGIQSAYRHAKELGRFDLVLIDEAHMIPPDGDGMYRTLISDLKAINPNLRIVGLTATPYRMSTGSICAPENILNSICYQIGVRELIVQGYLCPLISKNASNQLDTNNLHVRGGEFISSEVEALMDQASLVDSAAREIVDYTKDRRACLIFASGVQHGTHVAEALAKRGQRVECVFGDTLDFQRAQTLADFKAGKLKYLVNVNVLTTGVDVPILDSIALLRPTLSPGLFYQQCGRGFRLHPSKQNCLILDFGGNVLRHGPVDAILAQAKQTGIGEPPAKECPACHSLIAAGYAICPDCGHIFPARAQHAHDGKASNVGVLTGQVSLQIYEVLEIAYSVHTKRGASPGAPRTLRVDYRVALNQWQSEWVCVEHVGFARQKAEAWWSLRANDPCPDSAASACEMAYAGALREPASITVRHVAGDEFARIVGYTWPTEDKSWRNNPEPEYVPADDDIPF